MSSALSSTFLAALSLTLASCATTDPIPAQANAGKGGLNQVVGEWTYSHIGTPTIWQADLPDPASMINDKMDGTIITITRDGTASLVSSAGDARILNLSAGEETEHILKLEGRDLELDDNFTWVYEKRRKAITMPLQLTLPGNQLGEIPAYFIKR
jgi:hypothetical protein